MPYATIVYGATCLGAIKTAMPEIRRQFGEEISEDDCHRAEDNIQKITDQHIALIERSLTDKENSLLEI